MKKTFKEFTREMAKDICEAVEVIELLENEEEVRCMKENNPSLLEAYKALYKYSIGKIKGEIK